MGGVPRQKLCCASGDPKLMSELLLSPFDRASMALSQCMIFTLAMCSTLDVGVLHSIEATNHANFSRIRPLVKLS